MTKMELENLIEKMRQEVEDSIAKSLEIVEKAMKLEEKLLEIYERIQAYECEGKAVPDRLLKAKQVIEYQLATSDKLLEKIDEEITEKHAEITKLSDALIDKMIKSAEDILAEQQQALEEQNKKLNDTFKKHFGNRK